MEGRHSNSSACSRAPPRGCVGTTAEGARETGEPPPCRCRPQMPRGLAEPFRERELGDDPQPGAWGLLVNSGDGTTPALSPPHPPLPASSWRQNVDSSAEWRPSHVVTKDTSGFSLLCCVFWGPWEREGMHWACSGLVFFGDQRIQRNFLWPRMFMLPMSVSVHKVEPPGRLPQDLATSFEFRMPPSLSSWDSTAARGPGAGE